MAQSIDIVIRPPDDQAADERAQRERQARLIGKPGNDNADAG